MHAKTYRLRNKRYYRNNKGFKPIWEFTYRIVNEEKERIKVVDKNPDNLFVLWITGAMTLHEKLKASNMI
jgi:hypothetical protein